MKLLRILASAGFLAASLVITTSSVAADGPELSSSIAAPLAAGKLEVEDLLSALDARYSSDPLSFGTGLIRAATSSQQGAATSSQAEESRPFYYLSESYNPGDLDGDALDDLLLVAIDQDMTLLLKAYGGVDGAELWSWSQPDFTGYSSFYFQWADLSPQPGNEVVTYRTRYFEDAETGGDLLTGYTQDHLVQDFRILDGGKGTELWRWLETATFTDSGGISEAPYTDEIFEIRDLVTSMWISDDVDRDGSSDIFMGISSYRDQERYVGVSTDRYLGVGAGGRSVTGSVHATFRSGTNGNEVQTLHEDTSVGIPLADPMADMSGDGLPDVVFSLPVATNELGVQATSFTGEILWTQSAAGEGAYFVGTDLNGDGVTEVIGRADRWVEDEGWGHVESTTHAWDGRSGQRLWQVDRELRIVPLGDIDLDAATDLLLTDSVNPAEAQTVEAVSGLTLARLWGPLEVAPEVEGAEVNGLCICDEGVNLNGDQVKDIAFIRSSFANGSVTTQGEGISGATGDSLWVYADVWNGLRPIPGGVDLNGNGTSDLWASPYPYHHSFREGSDGSVISELDVDRYWAGPMAANLIGDAAPELVFHRVQTWDPYTDTSVAYSGTTRLWETSHI